jgi:signal transduction histidine kinase
VDRGGSVFLPVGAALASAGGVVAAGLTGGGWAILLAGLAGLLAGAAVRLHLRVRADHRRVLAALAHRDRLLQHAARLQARSELTGMVVHRLRNQLQVAAGHTSLGLHEAPAERSARLREVEAAIIACRELTDVLLGGPVRAQAQDVDAAALVARTAGALRHLLPLEVELQVAVPDRPAMVCAAAGELEDALVNLIVNASQAVGAQGRILISLRSADGVVTIAVADDGPGIAPEHLPQLFQPFFTTKGPGFGTGLGLASVERFARSNGGAVDVQSRPGEGACFTLRLPAAQGAALRA